MRLTKKLTAGLLAVMLTVSGVSVMAGTVKAEQPIVKETGVRYEEFSVSNYWTTGEKKAPTKDGYVFGGWYTKESNDVMTALKESEMSGTERAWAKFVPAEVLSVKAQIDEKTSKNGANRTEYASIRLISGVDSTDYQKVGFKVLLNNTNELNNSDGSKLETTKVYSGLKTTAESATIVYPNTVFGKAATKFSVWRLDEIVKENDTKIINVTPYWITLDGTKVEGLSKYVHIEDGYKGYVSVPVNLRSAEQIAAGKVTVSYPEGLTLAEDKTEMNDVFKKNNMAIYNDTAKRTITIVGNAENVNTNVAANGILANLRFTKGDTTSEGFLKFNATNEDFCNWDEATVSIDVWDIQY